MQLFEPQVMHSQIKIEFVEQALVSDSTHLNPFSTLIEAYKLLSQLPTEIAERIVLIGGQALLLWAEHYLIDQATGLQYGLLASDDLDFMGKRPEVIDCAAAWHAEHKLPSCDDNTPQSGIVFLNNSGVFNTIDFLSSVYGINDKEVLTYSDHMIFGNNNIRVLSPPLCLKSRIENLSGLNYTDELQKREVVRITAAIEVTKRYLIDICDSGHKSALSKAVTYIMRRVILSRSGISTSAKYGINLAEVFPITAIKATYPPIADEYLKRWLITYEDAVKRRPKSEFK